MLRFTVALALAAGAFLLTALGNSGNYGRWALVAAPSKVLAPSAEDDFR